MFERFTENARRVVVLAQEESRLLQHHDIRVEHLLLGLLRVDDDGAARTVLGVTLAKAHRAVAVVSLPESSPSTGHIPFTANTKGAMEIASNASRRRDELTGPGHLLMGLLRVHDLQIESVLTSLRVDLDAALAKR